MTFFVLKNGSRLGPLTVEKVAIMVRKGELVMSDIAWCEGNSEWFPIHQNNDLVAAVIPPLPESHANTASGQSATVTDPTLANSNVPPPTPHFPVETAQCEKLEWEGTKKILQGVGLIILAAILLAFMMFTTSQDDAPPHAFDPPHNQFPFSHKPNNLFSGHVLEADSALAHAMEEQLPALSRSFRVNHTLGWMIVIFLVVVGIVKIVEGLKIIESAKEKRHDKK